VSLGWFDRVTIASLLPGHTHEDIDMLFSMLWRRLKKPDGAATVLTWPEIIRSAQDVYCGWDQPPPAGSAAGRVQISEIGAVASFQQAFGLGRWAGKASPLRPVRNGAIKGLFGKGSDPEKKPHRFVIERGVNGPTVTAYFTAARDSPIFRTESPIFGFTGHLLRSSRRCRTASRLALIQENAATRMLKSRFTSRGLYLLLRPLHGRCPRSSLSVTLRGRG
jgi:hypothetical protein